MDQVQINQILEDHQVWLNDNTKGKRADLQEADLYRENFRGANLQEANFHKANLQGAYLIGANLQGADLRNADLRNADLRWANLESAKLPDFLIVPKEGEFYGYKKLSNDKVVKLKIPADAQRVNAIGSKKCRASYAIPVEDCGTNSGGYCYNHRYNRYGCSYKKNVPAYPDSFNDDIRVECTHGIHFFMKREEAEKC